MNYEIDQLHICMECDTFNPCITYTDLVDAQNSAGSILDWMKSARKHKIDRTISPVVAIRTFIVNYGKFGDVSYLCITIKRRKT